MRKEGIINEEDYLESQSGHGEDGVIIGTLRHENGAEPVFIKNKPKTDFGN